MKTRIAMDERELPMFTGIIEEVGQVYALQIGGNSAKITVKAEIASLGTIIGDSVSINGVCLTVTQISGSQLSFDAVPETVKRTSLRSLRVGMAVNLERALAAGQRMGGHMVQGHVDGSGVIDRVTQVENAHVLRVRADMDILRYMIPKGSVALDGISLTIAEVRPSDFTMWIIPHTYNNTNLHQLVPGDSVNIENDMIARYVEHFLSAKNEGSGISPDWLAENGFIE